MEELDIKTEELARMMLNNSSRAITLSKQLIQKGIYTNTEGFQLEGEAFQERFSSGEPKRKLKEFLGRS